MMYQCIKQYGSIKTGSFWNVDRYIVNSDGERRKVIITNEENSLLLSMTEFENHFAQANKPLTEQEYLQTCDTEQLADVLWEQINGAFNSGYACCYLKQDKDYIGRYKRFEKWLKQPHSEVGK